MKKHILTFWIFLLVLGLVTAQTSAPTAQWIRANNGQKGNNENVVKSVKDANGNYFVLAQDNNDVFISKFDNSGTLINTIKYNEPTNGTNSGSDIEVDNTGNIYHCGGAFVQTQWQYYPITVKMSPTGNILWTVLSPCQYYTNSKNNAIALDNNTGGVFYCGANSDSLSVGFINSNGTLQWVKNYASAGYGIGEAMDVVVDNFSNAYVTGKIMNTATSNYDYITFKINSAGTIVWTKLLNGNANADDAGLDIEIDGSSNTYVAGTMADTSTTNLSSFLVKYNASGGQQWIKKHWYTGQTNSAPGAITVDASGTSYIGVNHYTAGVNVGIGMAQVFRYTNSGSPVYSFTYSEIGYDEAEITSMKVDALGNCFIGGTKYFPGGSAGDVFIAKYNLGGIFQWQANYNSYGFELGRTLHLDNGNNAIISAVSSGTGNSSDVSLIKYSSSGVFQWESFYTGMSNPNDENIKVFSQGNYSIYSLGTIENDFSSFDCLISKYDNQGNILWQNVQDFGANSNTARDMQHDANYNVSVLCDFDYQTSVIFKYDSIGSPIFTTNLNSNTIFKKLKIDNAGAFVAGGDRTFDTRDFVIAKLNSTGSFLFQTNPTSATNYSTEIAGIEVDGNNRIFAFGEVNYDLYSPNPIRRFQVQRFNPATGAIVWTKKITGVDSTGGVNMPYWKAKKIIVDAANDIYVLMTAQENGGPNYYALVVKYDINGNELWRAELNNNNVRTDFGVDMVSSSGATLVVLTVTQWQSANIYRLNKTTGAILLDQEIQTSGTALTPTALFENGAGNLYIASRAFQNFLGSISVIKTDANAQTLWTSTTPGNQLGDNWPRSIDVSGNDRIYVAGGMIMSSGQSTDAAILKLCDIVPNTISFLGSTQNICPGNFITLDAGSANSFNWNVAGNNGQTFQAGITGNYYCTTYKQDGCFKNTDTVMVTIKNPPTAPNICQVTVDTASTHNIIYWDKTLITGADSVKIYREDVTNVYSYIGAVHMDSLSEYHDIIADPNVTTKRYKISAIDSCGNESVLSPYHNTIYIIYNGLGQFSWNPLYTIENGANPVNNYVLMRDTLSNGNWEQISTTAGTQSTIVDPNYSNYPNARYRVETVWNISCDPTRALINTSRSNIKAQLAGPTTSLNENNNTQVSFAPNPFNQFSQLDIRTQSGKINFVFELFDETGRLVRTENITTSKFILNKGELANGIYFYNLKDKDSTFTKKGKLIAQQ